MFVLPADAWKDYNMLDWVLSIKNQAEGDSTADSFNDLMLKQFTAKKTSGGISQYKLMIMNPHMDKLSSSSSIDHKIDTNEAWVDSTLKAM